MSDPPDDEKPKGATILDLRDRLPPHIFGDNPAGNLAVKILKVIIENDEGAPHIWLAALLMTSRTLRRLLREGYGVSDEKMRVINEMATRVADNMEINIDYKNPPVKGA